MLRGKFWLEADSTLIDVSASEHAVYARNRLLQWDRTINKRAGFGKLTRAEKKHASTLPDAQKHEIDLYNTYELTDPRVWYIKRRGAIRIRENKSYFATLTVSVLAAFAHCAAYWKIQCEWGLLPNDMLEFYGLDGTKMERTFVSFAETYCVEPRFLDHARRNA